MIKPKKEEMKKEGAIKFLRKFETLENPRTHWDWGGELFLIPSPKSSS